MFEINFTLLYTEACSVSLYLLPPHFSWDYFPTKLPVSKFLSQVLLPGPLSEGKCIPHQLLSIPQGIASCTLRSWLLLNLPHCRLCCLQLSHSCVSSYRLFLENHTCYHQSTRKGRATFPKHKTHFGNCVIHQSEEVSL